MKNLIQSFETVVRNAFMNKGIIGVTKEEQEKLFTFQDRTSWNKQYKGLFLVEQVLNVPYDNLHYYQVENIQEAWRIIVKQIDFENDWIDY